MALFWSLEYEPPVSIILVHIIYNYFHSNLITLVDTEGLALPYCDIVTYTWEVSGVGGDNTNTVIILLWVGGVCTYFISFQM